MNETRNPGWRYLKTMTSIAVSVFGTAGCSPPVKDPGGAASLYAVGTMVDSVPLFRAGSPRDQRVRLSGLVQGAIIGGTVVVVDGTSHMYLFDLHGELKRKLDLTANGGAPLRAVASVGQCARDSIFVWDSRRGVVVFDMEGKRSRQFQPPGPARTMSCSASGVIAFMLMPQSAMRQSDLGKLEPLVSTLALTDIRGMTGASMAVAFGEWRLAGRITSVAVLADRVYVGTGESSSIDVLDTMLRPAGKLETGVPRRAMTAREYLYALQHRYGFTDSTARKLANTVPMPAFQPTLAGLTASNDGTVWAEVSGPADSETKVRAFAPNGKALGDIRFPDGTSLLAADSLHLLTARTISRTDVEVGVFTLRRPSTAGR